MKTTLNIVPTAGRKLRNILIPLIAFHFVRHLPESQKPSNQPVIAVPIAQPNFWLMEEEENIKPVARLPVFSSE